MTLSIPESQQAGHEEWLLHLTRTPSAAGREHRVSDWVRQWVRDRDDLALDPDPHGNLHITQKRGGDRQPVVITAHMDHPAFVVESVHDDGTLALSFRGWIADAYAENARIRLFTHDDDPVGATLTDSTNRDGWRDCRARLDDPGDAARLRPGDVGLWELDPPRVEDALLHAPAIDDLGGVAAALAALDVIRDMDGCGHVSVFLTRAEETGFVGATAACRSGSLPRSARVVTLETSRAIRGLVAIGGGPVSRQGDRMSTFDPELTYAIDAVARGLAALDETFRWQRKLLDGGTCESTVFRAYGYRAACISIPLGNYHNQGDIDAFDDGTLAEPRVAHEYIALADFHRLIQLLCAIAARLDDQPPVTKRTDTFFEQRSHILD